MVCGIEYGGWVLWEVSRHHHGMLKAICRSWRRGGGGCRWTTEVPPSFAVEVKEDRKEDENHRSRRDHEIDRPNMHSFQRQTIGDCLVFGAMRGGFTHICVGSGSTAGRLSEGLAPRAPQADWPGSVAQAVRTRLQLQRSDKRV